VVYKPGNGCNWQRKVVTVQLRRLSRQAVQKRCPGETRRWWCRSRWWCSAGGAASQAVQAVPEPYAGSVRGSGAGVQVRWHKRFMAVAAWQVIRQALQKPCLCAEQAGGRRQAAVSLFIQVVVCRVRYRLLAEPYPRQVCRRCSVPGYPQTSWSYGVIHIHITDPTHVRELSVMRYTCESSFTWQVRQVAVVVAGRRLSMSSRQVAQNHMASRLLQAARNGRQWSRPSAQ